MTYDLIFAYTRAQAISDGVLVDASELAKEAGFRFPVAFTQDAYAECVALHPEDVGQDETGRIWDVLSVLRVAAKQGGTLVRFQVSVQRGESHKPVSLKAHVGPGDTFEPVITIMLPHED